jgi:hypothetical protein
MKNAPLPGRVDGEAARERERCELLDAARLRPNVTRRERLWRRHSRCSAVIPTRLLVIAAVREPSVSTRRSAEEDASGKRQPLVRASAAEIRSAMGSFAVHRGGSRFGRWFGKVLNGSRRARREGGARRPDPAGGGAEGTGASQAPPPSSSRLRLDVRPRRATVAGRQHRNQRPAARGGAARWRARRDGERELTARADRLTEVQQMLYALRYAFYLRDCADLWCGIAS